MGNWSIVIKGVGTKPHARTVGLEAVADLQQIGQDIRSAEFISDTPEDSANLLAERDAAASAFVSLKDGGTGYEKVDPPTAPEEATEANTAPTAPEEATEANTAPTEPEQKVIELGDGKVSP